MIIKKTSSSSSFLFICFCYSMFIFINIISYIINMIVIVVVVIFYIILTSNDFFCDAPKYIFTEIPKTKFYFSFSQKSKIMLDNFCLMFIVVWIK